MVAKSPHQVTKDFNVPQKVESPWSGVGRKRPCHKLKQKFIAPHSFPGHFGCLILEQARYGSIKMDKVDG